MIATLGIILAIGSPFLFCLCREGIFTVFAKATLEWRTALQAIKKATLSGSLSIVFTIDYRT